MQKVRKTQCTDLLCSSKNSLSTSFCPQTSVQGSPPKKKQKKKFFEPILNLYTTVNSSNKPRKVPYTDFGPKKTISHFQDFLLL